MNVNTTTATLTQNDLNKIVFQEQDFLRYNDVKRLAEINDLSLEDALFEADAKQAAIDVVEDIQAEVMA